MELGELALAPGTRRRYKSCVATFCKVTGPLSEVAATLEGQVQDFVLWAWEQDKSHSWVTGHLAAVSHHVKLGGLADPTRSFPIRAALKGWARGEDKKRDNRAPIDFRILQALIDCVPSAAYSDHEASLFKAAFCLAFFGAFRISELVASSKTDGSLRALCLRDVNMHGGILSITLRKSKTDQMGRGREIVLRPLDPPAYCPVTLTASYLLLRPHGDGYLLLHADNSPLTKHQFGSVLKRVLMLSGNNGRKYSTHSFRIGAASAAHAVGLPAESIKRLGRWDSNCYKRYIRPD